MIDSYVLSSFQQGVLFSLSALVSMLYHYLDRYIRTKERLLDDVKSIWQALQILVIMLVGSTYWAEIREVANSDIVITGFILGLAAFSKGVEKLNDNIRK